MLTDPINRAIRAVPAWVLYILSPILPAWWLWLGLTGGLGVEPIEALEHLLGEAALYLLVAGLAVTPLRRFAGINLMSWRRAIGVICFAYVALHLLVWLVLDVQIPAQIWADILKRPYVTVGFGAFLLLLPLAMTSNNWSVRRLGPRWRRLHRLIYPAAILAGLHYVWLAKGFQIEPLLWLAAILVLLALRLVPKRASRPARAGNRAASGG